MNAAAVTASGAAELDMKKNNVKFGTKKLALSAMLCALGVVMLTLGSVLSALDLTMVAMASILVYFAVLEMGTPYQYLIYAVTGILSILLLPDKFAAFLYLIFGGIYPILKRLVERLHNVPCWIIKLIYFNAVITVMVLGSKYLFGIDDEKLSIGIYALGNAAFILYDIAMTKLLTMYLTKLRKKLKVEKYFEK